ncbi:MAG TPA: cytochrome c [Candidatus Dormibacteraeota bacterium]|nr:cytochrome c [Candidatus Dormibacteraeota bacterium]
MTPAASLSSVGLVLALALAGCDILPGKARARAIEETAATPAMAFDALYARQCAGCHGNGGRLGAARPLNDPVYLALVPAERLRLVIAEGVPGTAQPAFARSAGGGLTEEQIDALVQGLVRAWARPEETKSVQVPPYAAALGDPDRGKAVYAAACAGCHGADGRGGPKAGSVVDPSYLALVSDQYLRTTVIAGRADVGMPDWRGYIPGRPLAPAEISAVVGWLVAQRRPVPGRPTASASDPR